MPGSETTISAPTRRRGIFRDHGERRGAPGFSDVNSDREQALQLLAEIVRLGPAVQVIALLEGNDPDFILRALRAGPGGFF